jgi:hypothetical protein
MRLVALVLLALASVAQATEWNGPVPAAVTTDPPRDAEHPAHSAELLIPSDKSELNALIYMAAGAGAHPTVILLHGFPGNEQNLDLAQAIRRAGWNVLTLHYRGAWGSPPMCWKMSTPSPPSSGIRMSPPNMASTAIILSSGVIPWAASPAPLMPVMILIFSGYF